MLVARSVVGVLDQTSAANVPQYRTVATSYHSDGQFVRRIEQRIGTGGSVFQLPYVPFPDGGVVHRITDYDLVRGYLHSDGCAGASARCRAAGGLAGGARVAAGRAPDPRRGRCRVRRRLRRPVRVRRRRREASNVAPRADGRARSRARTAVSLLRPATVRRQLGESAHGGRARSATACDAGAVDDLLWPRLRGPAVDQRPRVADARGGGDARGRESVAVARAARRSKPSSPARPGESAREVDRPLPRRSPSASRPSAPERKSSAYSSSHRART